LAADFMSSTPLPGASAGRWSAMFNETRSWEEC
jgi:hypothetical protein